MNPTRRGFLCQSAAAAAFGQAGKTAIPWYRRTYRWGQTNITEKDPTRYDIAWWREYWKKTAVQGVIINAGGIVAYYPSKFPLHKRAEFLGDRDLYGELAEAAHKDGLAVFARMDSNRTAEDFYRAHPDWFALDINGKPYRSADKYITCVNSLYYDEYLTGILREIIERSKPEGITDNSWAGLGRDSICYCANCERKFREKTGQPIPRTHDWDAPVYRQWIEWNYARRLEIWDLNNKTTRAAGGPHCVWAGMNSGSVSAQARSFRNLREICRRSEIVMLDHQRRDDATGFQQNTDTGKLVHGLLGWEKLAPESMAMYQAGRSSFRVAAKPAAEARMWMIAGIAGGIQPWWHHIGAYQEDRRMFRTAEPVMRWHMANQDYLVDRRPVATVGLVWSQGNTDYFGRDRADELVDAPYRGMMQALVRARIPYVPVNADDIERDSTGLAALILPNLGAMSDQHCAAIGKFFERGGGVIATGATSLYTEWGVARGDYGLANLFGAHVVKAPDKRWAAGSYHTYLRMDSEDKRHEVLRGFEETDILPFGGMLEQLKLDPNVTAPLTFVPPFPVYPPETAWMREPKTDIPGLVLKQRGANRVAFLPADIDRRYAKENLPDHGNLLASVVRWACHDNLPLRVEGAGLIDCNLYQQRDRLILHLVNLTNVGAWRAPLDELIPVGPLKVRVRTSRHVDRREVKLLVAGGTTPATDEQGWSTFEIKSVLDHEVAVIA